VSMDEEEEEGEERRKTRNSFKVGGLGFMI
jgi:hypothetical protein